MNGLPKPDFSNYGQHIGDRFNTPSPLKPIKIGPTQNPNINRIRSFETMLEDAEPQYENNVDYMRTLANRVNTLNVNK